LFHANPVCLSYFLKVDEYGTQQPIAVLKLLLERGGMYDRGKELNLKHYRDIGFIAAMGKVSG
jgi:dynein heavy chain